MAGLARGDGTQIILLVSANGELSEAIARYESAGYRATDPYNENPYAQRWFVQPVAGETPTLDELVEHCRSELAGFKIPKSLVVVDEVVRSPAGKADLR